MKTDTFTPVSNPEPVWTDMTAHCSFILRLILFLVPAAVLCAPAARAADSYPPNRLTYQGFLVDANGAPLGDTAPRNYDVVFRIWKNDSSTAAGDRLWTEQQTVTVDKGYFSVLLGEGASVGSEPGPSNPPNNTLNTLFVGNTASDRFVEMTVKGIGTGNADSTIAPRLRLFTTPYAFLARSASTLVSDSGGALISGSGTTVNVAGTVSATSFSGSGASLTGLTASQIPSLDAGKITGTLHTDRIPALNASKITGGTLDSARIPSLDAGKITGTLDSARIPGLDAGKITGGTIDVSRLPSSLVRTDTLSAIDPSGTTKLRIGANSSDVGGKRIVFGDGSYVFVGESSTNDDVLSLYGGDGVTIDGNDDPIAVKTTSAIQFDTSNGKTFSVIANYVQIYHASNKDKKALWSRDDDGFFFDAVGGTSRGGSDRKVIKYDGDSNWDFSSDRRLKKDIVDAESVLQRVMAVKMRRFRWIGGNPETAPELGVIAQEFQPLFPELVSKTTPDTPNPACPDGVMTVGVTSLGTIAIKAIQELKQEKDAEIAALRRENEALKQQIEAFHGTAASVASLQKEMAGLKESIARTAAGRNGNDRAGQSASGESVRSSAIE